ncbi:hypothetical protein Cgig2_022695 [Carnegiea gigantea]|uniref:Uncharacterized protein n=1 Tax=Carnegiea gigantea TaxID=171969 RepID=A0A9Q1Q5U8_9CARY|nr:hypothetical protein Cgig2_022695 [Carnegiea gigantea]
MIIRSLEPKLKFLVDRDPVKTSFEEWVRSSHFSRTIAKGPETTTLIWNPHADAHDFDSHTSDLEEISQKNFSAHFSKLSTTFLWLSGTYFHGARRGFQGMQITSGFFQIWRASGITSELQLYCTAIGALVFVTLMLFAGATPFFTLNLSKYAEFLTFYGGLDPVTGGLWLTDIAHHHLAIAILFLIAGHMYRTNWGISHGLKRYYRGL